MKNKSFLILCLCFSISYLIADDELDDLAPSAPEKPETIMPKGDGTRPATPGKGKTTIKNAPSAVLNFESDMIEGEKRKPDLFSQTHMQDLDLDAILYLRNDFNDFHVVDHKRRTRHVRFRVKK